MVRSAQKEKLCRAIIAAGTNGRMLARSDLE